MLTLEDIIAAKEVRVDKQKDFLERFGAPLVSMSLNIPGVEKDSEELRLLAQYGFNQVLDKLRANHYPVRYAALDYLPTGPEALIAVDAPAEAVKRICMDIEQQHRFCRLLDLDVIDGNGMPLSRRDFGATGRTCFLCDEDAIICRRMKRHTPAEVAQAVRDLLAGFAAQRTRTVEPAAERIGAVAVEAMLAEVGSTPSPGLVDRINSGAHIDMDFFTFMDSTAALAFTMARCAQAGINHRGALPGLLPVLRLIGQAGETAMFRATGGVNTHKGLLFTMGITAAAAGWCARHQELDPNRILAVVQETAAGLVERELGRLDAAKEKLTAGERLYRDYGITGVRGELERGFPAIRTIGLPMLRQALAKGLTRNAALLQTLMHLMVCVEDTTVMHRHDPAILSWVRQQAQRFLDEGGLYSAQGPAKLEELDRLFISRNVSPGGAADMLAVAWFLHRIEEMRGFA